MYLLPWLYNDTRGIYRHTHATHRSWWNDGLSLVADKVEEEKTKNSGLIKLLEEDYTALANRRIKDRLSAFLPDIPGDIDTMDSADSSLRAIIERPPVAHKDLIPLSSASLAGFRLAPGAVSI